MEKFSVKVELPNDSKYCNSPYERCRFLIGNNYCLLLDDTTPTDRGDACKLRECPAWVKEV